VEFVVPAPLPKTMIAKIQRLAIRAFQAVDAPGLQELISFFDATIRNCS